MLDTLLRLWANLYTRIGLIVVLSLIAIWFLQQTQIAWGSFIIAFTIAYVANPFVSWFENKRFLSRSSGVFIVLTFLILLLVIVVFLLTVLGAAFTRDINILPFIRWIQGLPNWAENALPSWVFSEQNSDNINTLLENARTNLISWSQNVATGFFKGIGGFVGILLQAGLVLVLAGYIMQSFPSITKNLLKIFPPRRQKFISELGEKLDIAVGGYIRAKIIEAIIVGAVVWVTLVLIGIGFGLPSMTELALPIAVVAAILNPIPYLGPAVATIPAVLVGFGFGVGDEITGDEFDLIRGIITLVAMLVIQQLDGNVLGPLLLQQSVNLHPVMVLVALLVGSSLFGFWGLLLAIPITAFVQLLYSDYYLTSDWYEGRPWHRNPTNFDADQDNPYKVPNYSNSLYGPVPPPTYQTVTNNAPNLDLHPKTTTNGNRQKAVRDTFTDENVASAINDPTKTAPLETAPIKTALENTPDISNNPKTS